MNQKTKKVASLFAADDDSVIRELVKYYATRASISHQIFESGDALLQNLNEEVQVCLIDLDMPGSSGLQCLEIIKKRFPHIEVIILTGNNQATDAIAALKAGAFDYVIKPFDPEELTNCIRNAKLLNTKHCENIELRSSFSEGETTLDMLGNSPAMKDVMASSMRISESHGPVLITGESGTGKTLLARQIHKYGKQKNGPFVCVSCPSIPKELLESEMFGHEKGSFSGATHRKLGKAELANKGTLFLDEIGEMSPSLQAKLLNFLQDKNFYRVGGEKLIQSQTRIIAATNQNLKNLVSQGLFREDLYFRLNVLPIEMPPLRNRQDDIPLLFKHFLEKTASESNSKLPKYDSSLIELLQNQIWKGNVRELENAIVRAFTMRDNKKELSPSDFRFVHNSNIPSIGDPDEGKNQPSKEFVGKTLLQIEQIAINDTIDYCSGNKARAAKMLGIAEKSIYNKLNRFQKNT